MPNAVHLPFWQSIQHFKRNFALLYTKMINGTIIVSNLVIA